MWAISVGDSIPKALETRRGSDEVMKSFTAKDAKDTKEKKSFAAKDAKDAKGINN
jgi:hypothetical protein